jgi:glyoxylase-like metal-dependent hydrolase (beta-lactamase superfamily II)
MHVFRDEKSKQLQKVQVGDWMVWPLNDGYLDLDQKMFAGIEPAVLRQMLAQAGVKCVDDLVVRTEVRAFLVDTGRQLILIDTGAGNRCGPTTGFLTESLRKTGHDISQISLVLITHLHPDHESGLLTRDGTSAFTAATVGVSAIEATYWRDPIQESKANDSNRHCFALAREMLGPYEQHGKLHLIQPNEMIIPGVTAVAAPGHTPGHMAFLFRSKEDQILFWGDLVHSLGIQFAKPEWHVVFDIDGHEASLSRQHLFAEAADKHLLIGGAHLPQPGFGYVVRAGAAFTWQAL